MNKIFLVGRLADNPESYTTSKGNPQARVSIACQDNRIKSETYFFPCIAWQQTANFINTYLKKGDLVCIDGKLTRRSFTSKEGKQISVTEIVIENIQSLASKKVETSPELKSIDKAFPESVITQDLSETKEKKENLDNNNKDVEWQDEIK